MNLFKIFFIEVDEFTFAADSYIATWLIELSCVVAVSQHTLSSILFGFPRLHI